MTTRSGEQYILAFKTSLTVWFPISEISQYSQMRWCFEVDCIWDTINCRTVSAEPADTGRKQSYGHQKIRKLNLYCFFLQAQALLYRPRKPGPMLDPGAKSRKQCYPNFCWSCWWNELSKAAIHHKPAHLYFKDTYDYLEQGGLMVLFYILSP